MTRAARPRRSHVRPRRGRRAGAARSATPHPTPRPARRAPTADTSPPARHIPRGDRPHPTRRRPEHRRHGEGVARENPTDVARENPLWRGRAAHRGWRARAARTTARLRGTRARPQGGGRRRGVGPPHRRSAQAMPTAPPRRTPARSGWDGAPPPRPRAAPRAAAKGLRAPVRCRSWWHSTDRFENRTSPNPAIPMRRSSPPPDTRITGHQPCGTCVRSHTSSRPRSAATATSFAVDVRPCVRVTPPSCPGRVRRDGYRGSAPAAPPAPRRRLHRTRGAGPSWPCLWSPRRSSRALNGIPCAGGVLAIEVRKTRAFRVTAPVFIERPPRV